jgi:ArsR family transcriptional regulator
MAADGLEGTVDIRVVTLSADRWQRSLMRASIAPMTIQTELIGETAVEFPCPPLGAAELSAAEAERMAGMFKALADPVRLRLFSRVAAHSSGEASVCDIQNVGVSQPTVSHHLKKLREAGLIISERRGTWVYCRVAPGVLPAMAQMLSPRDMHIN